MSRAWDSAARTPLVAHAAVAQKCSAKEVRASGSRATLAERRSVAFRAMPTRPGPCAEDGHGRRLGPAWLHSWQRCGIIKASRDRPFLLEQSAYPLDICCGTQGVALICGQFKRHRLPVEASDEIFVVGDVPTISVTDQVG